VSYLFDIVCISATEMPDSISHDEMIEDCGTAGAISLILQVSLPVLIYSNPMRLILRGGTDVLASPPIDHTKNVLLPLLHRMGVNVNIDTTSRGFYPKGGGEVVVTLLVS